MFVDSKEQFKEYVKIAITRVIGILIPALIFIVYLIVTHSLVDFINYAILGIKTFSNKINYIFVLCYTQFDTNDYVKTVDYEDEYVEFRQVNSFGNYYLQSIDEIKNEENNAYVIRKEDLEKYQINQEEFKITEFEKYVVIENK